MRALFSRSNTPARSDSAVVEASAVVDVTEQQEAPLDAIPAPVPGPARRRPSPGDVARSRKQTLVSPIPALLAAQMGDVPEDRSDNTPPPQRILPEPTSRFDSAVHQALSGPADVEGEDETDYVVELVPPAPKPRR